MTDNRLDYEFYNIEPGLSILPTLKSLMAMTEFSLNIYTDDIQRKCVIDLCYLLSL